MPLRSRWEAAANSPYPPREVGHEASDYHRRNGSRRASVAHRSCRSSPHTALSQAISGLVSWPMAGATSVWEPFRPAGRPDPDVKRPTPITVTAIIGRLGDSNVQKEPCNQHKHLPDQLPVAVPVDAMTPFTFLETSLGGEGLASSNEHSRSRDIWLLCSLSNPPSQP